MKAVQTILFLFASSFAFVTQAAVEIQHWTTESGTRVYFVENHDLPIVDIAVTFAAGAAYDSPEKAGRAGITHYMMDTGAAGMDEEAITNAFADIGAQLGGSAATDSATYSLRTLTSEQNKALSVFKKILHQPDFPESILAREKKRIIAGLQEAKTRPGSIANKAFKKALYGQHPYGIQSTEDTVKALTVDNLRQFYQTYYTSNSAVIALMGDMTKSQAENIATSISAGLPKGTSVPSIKPVQALTASSLEKIPHPASQAHILMGQPGIKRRFCFSAH